MPIRFSRTPDSQFGTTPVNVPLSLFDESLGSVRLWLRELPAGLADELAERFAAAEDKRECLREYAAWGVSGHEASDFLDEAADGSLTPISYQSEVSSYHCRESRVTHSDTLDLYEHALPQLMFLYSIRAALSWYHVGVVPTPRQLWDSAKAKVKEASPLDVAQETST